MKTDIAVTFSCMDPGKASILISAYGKVRGVLEMATTKGLFRFESERFKWEDYEFLLKGNN